ncbi:torsin-2A-like [Petromyzon marinus]|uniref:torsin-2A-like n=1 Tax=Petromyzon marinus TaxID=7757 RepID=UPI003F6F313F
MTARALLALAIFPSLWNPSAGGETTPGAPHSTWAWTDPALWSGAVASWFNAVPQNGVVYSRLYCGARDCVDMDERRCQIRGHNITVEVLADNELRTSPSETYPSFLPAPSLRTLLGCLDHDCRIKSDLPGLRRELHRRLHGQHLARSSLERAAWRFSLARRDGTNVGPRLLMLFGGSGTGKSHAARTLARHLYSDGMSSQCVHAIVPSLLLSGTEDRHAHRERLETLLLEGVQVCEHSLFIVDSVEELSVGLLDDLLLHILDTPQSAYKKALFIFISSNIGTSLINTRTLEVLQSGRGRAEITMEELPDKLRQTMRQHLGDDAKSLPLLRLVTPVVFLPLEPRHVQLCVCDEFLARGRHPSPDLVWRLASSLAYWPQGEGLLAVAGCKHVAQRAALFMHQ